MSEQSPQGARLRGPLHQALHEAHYTNISGLPGDETYISPSLWLLGACGPADLKVMAVESEEFSAAAEQNAASAHDMAVAHVDILERGYMHAYTRPADETPDTERNAAAMFVVRSLHKDQPIPADSLNRMFGYASNGEELAPPLEAVSKAKKEAERRAEWLATVQEAVAREQKLLGDLATERQFQSYPLRMINHATAAISIPASVTGLGLIIGGVAERLEQTSEKPTANPPEKSLDEVGSITLGVGLLCGAAHVAGKALLSRFAHFRARRQLHRRMEQRW